MGRESSVTRLFAWQSVPQFVYSVREQWLWGRGRVLNHSLVETGLLGIVCIVEEL